MEKLNQIISKHLNIPVEKLSDNISYENESKWDSVNHLKMVSEIEQAFGIEFDVDEITAMENIGKIRKFVEEKTKK